jgi:hypothetical protein
MYYSVYNYYSIPPYSALLPHGISTFDSKGCFFDAEVGNLKYSGSLKIFPLFVCGSREGSEVGGVLYFPPMGPWRVFFFLYIIPSSWTR